MVKKRPSKLLLLLAEYFGFSLLCGFVSMLFFSWASGVIASNYMEMTGTPINLATWYLLKMLAFVPGILIFIFSLAVLVQRKFSYMVKISNAIEEMEAGNLDKRILVEGDDELSDLAASVNRFAQTVQEERDTSQRLKEEQFHTIATLSHDLRTPLTSVMSYLQFIRDGNYGNEKKMREYAEKAYEKAYRIKEMTDELFENCRQTKETENQLTKVDGPTFLTQILWEMQDFLSDLNYETSLSLPEQWSEFSVKVDKERIPRILDNLLSNIRKYADRSHPVILEAREEEENLIICQKNKVIGEAEKEQVESNLLGLRSVEKTVIQSGGAFHTWEIEDTFVLEIKLPMIRNY